MKAKQPGFMASLIRMRAPVILLFLGVLASGSGVLSGQILIPPGDVVKTGSWITSDIRFRTDQDGDGGFDEQTQLAGLERIDVTLAGGGTVTAWDLCAEFFVGPNSGLPFSVSDGFGPWGDDEEDWLRVLISNAFPLFEAAEQGGDQSLADAYGSAIQIAMWEIVEDDNGLMIIDSTAPGAGIFQVMTDYPSSDPDTALALGYAQVFLDNVRTGFWTDAGGFNYYYADATPNQDRFWFTTEVIPEPSVPLLLALVCGAGLRRRRR